MTRLRFNIIYQHYKPVSALVSSILFFRKCTVDKDELSNCALSNFDLLISYIPISF